MIGHGVGRGGAKIKELEADSGARIKVIALDTCLCLSAVCLSV